MKDGKKIPKGYKPSPFGLIPNDWDVKELSRIFEFKNGINAGKESYGNGVKFINVMEVIYNSQITPDKIPGYVNISDVQKDLYLVKYGDVLFNRTSETTDEIGLTAVYEGKEEVVFGGFVIRARPIDDTLKVPFRRYCFRSKPVRDQIITRGQGAVRSNIGQGDLEKVVILVPPHKEQTAIANLLNTWDKAINTLTQLIAQKEQRKKWLMQQLLTGKKRLKGFEKMKWERVGAGEVFKNVSIKGNSDEQLLSATQDKGMIPRDMLEARVTMPKGETDSFKLVEKGDFVISLRSFQGGLEYSEYKGLVSPAYTVLKNQRKIIKDFYRYYFKSYDFIGHLAVAVIGIRDGKQISYDDFCFVNIPNPTMDEQKAISAVLKKADEELRLLQIKCERLKNQKKGLMQVLLTGKKRL